MPSLAGFAVFFIIPFVYTFYYAFTENAFTGKFAGLNNFVMLFGNRYFRLAMKNTLRFTALSVPLTMVLSLLIALAIAKFAARIPLVKSAFFLPVILPSAAIIMLWNAYFSDFAPISSLLSGVKGDMLDAAKIDGAGSIGTLFHVIIPNIAPTLFFTFILSIVNSFKIFRESYLLYGVYPDESVYMLQNYLNNHFMKLNYQNISTAAIFFAVVVYTVVAVVFAFEKKWSDSVW